QKHVHVFAGTYRAATARERWSNGLFQHPVSTHHSDLGMARRPSLPHLAVTRIFGGCPPLHRNHVQPMQCTPCAIIRAQWVLRLYDTGVSSPNASPQGGRVTIAAIGINIVLPRG